MRASAATASSSYAARSRAGARARRARCRDLAGSATPHLRCRLARRAPGFVAPVVRTARRPVMAARCASSVLSKRLPRLAGSAPSATRSSLPRLRDISTTNKVRCNDDHLTAGAGVRADGRAGRQCVLMAVIPRVVLRSPRSPNFRRAEAIHMATETEPPRRKPSCAPRSSTTTTLSHACHRDYYDRWLKAGAATSSRSSSRRRCDLDGGLTRLNYGATGTSEGGPIVRGSPVAPAPSGCASAHRRGSASACNHSRARPGGRLGHFINTSKENHQQGDRSPATAHSRRRRTALRERPGRVTRRGPLRRAMPQNLLVDGLLKMRFRRETWARPEAICCRGFPWMCQRLARHASPAGGERGGHVGTPKGPA